jgi:hypothetical protein
MGSLGKRATGFACGLLLAASPQVVPSGMAAAARTLLETLRPELRRDAVLPFADENRKDWHYVPRSRRGVSLKQMNAAERSAAHDLLRAGLSERGYEKTAGVIALEAILREIETFGFRRDPELYWLSIFGTPSPSAPWGWRFEGHHLSLNFSASTGELVAATPSFFGANPARVPEGRPRAGWRLLQAEEDLARRLLAILDSVQRAAAVISTDAPSEIFMTPGRRLPPPVAGLPYAQMNAAQQELLLALIGEYVGNLRPAAAQAQWQRIRAAGLDGIRFAWAGGTARGEGHYYRLQGPTFVIEYDNTQDRANHIHTVWRDSANDFGEDLLARHYRESPHHAEARTRAGTAPGASP